jgi:protein kinase-like protein
MTPGSNRRGASMSRPATDPSRPDPGPGEFPDIKGYRIAGVLGEGAVGTVYKARRTDTGVAVALKILHAAGPKRRKHIARLVKEGRVMARLNHPGIVKGLDVGESHGRYYIAMELVDGQSIRDHLEAGRIFTEEETLDVASKAARALHHAARQGVVHRDIKPANIMLTRDGKVKITDLGLAKDAIDLSLTRSDATVGTPQYIAPEQARDSQSVDVRSDLFALGATLYHMVTGQPPFTGGTLAEIITRVLYETEEPVERLNPAVSVSFARLISRMLAKDPEDRYQTYLELLADLDRARAGREIRGPVPRRRPGTGVRWRVTVLAVGCLAAAVIVAAWRPWRDPAPSPAPPTPPPVIQRDPPPVQPPRWERPLAEFQNVLLAMVDQGQFDQTIDRINQARPGFVNQGVAASDAFARIEEVIKLRIKATLKRSLGAAVSRYRESAMQKLEGSLKAEDFAAIYQGRDAIDQQLRNLPAYIELDFEREFRDALDTITQHAQIRAEEVGRKALREARRLAGDRDFEQANRTIKRIEGLQVKLFYPEVARQIEVFRDEMVKRRKEAQTDFEESYRAFRDGFESRMASWQFQQAEQELGEFEERVKPWQRGAFGESKETARMVEKDRNVFEGVMQVWEAARKRLAELERNGEPIKLFFGKEGSQKIIEAVKGGKYPELVAVHYKVGGRILTNRLISVSPEDVVEQLARKGGAIHPRCAALFYYFASKQPDLAPDEARRLLGLAASRFEESGGAGPNFQSRIEAWQRALNASEQERERWAQDLHRQAQEAFHRWEFKKAAGLWTRMKEQFSTVFKRDAVYRDSLRLARRSEPLEALKHRFPGAEREHRYQQADRPLAFRLTFRFRPGSDLTGLEFAWDCWELGEKGLVRKVENAPGASRKNPFPPTWGLTVPIKLNFKYDATLALEVETDESEIMKLLGLSLGGNIAALLSLDGYADRPASIQSNQVSLWASTAPLRRSGFDVFHRYEDRFQFPTNNAAPGESYRMTLGKVHLLGLEVRSKDNRLTFTADGLARAHRTVNRLRTVPEIEIRAWSKPITLRTLVIEGVLLPR